MLKQLRENIVQSLWKSYHHTTPQMTAIEISLKAKHIDTFFLDHFAIIDLPGPKSGIPALKTLFNMLGFEERGCGYLPDKQNDFVWMAETSAEKQLAKETLPQVVVADFRLDEMPHAIRTIIQKYAAQTKSLPLEKIQSLADKIALTEDALAQETLTRYVIDYLQGRDWPLPTVTEFLTVQAFNELLAWVLIFGRRPNHFTLSIHLLSAFTDLHAFHHFIKEEVGLALNEEGGTIKGNRASGILQGSTVGTPCKMKLADGEITLPTGFVEFVWRHPTSAHPSSPAHWRDYFTGFVAEHANHVIESLYTQG